MNLWAAQIPYIRVPRMILNLHRKCELVRAIDLYRLYDPESPLRIFIGTVEAAAAVAESLYQRRQRTQDLLALERAGVLRRGEQGGVLELVSLDNESSVSIIRFDYSKLSATAIKLVIACHATIRNRPRKDAFRFVATQPELAKMARVGERRITDALRQLSQLHFLETWPHNERKRYALRIRKRFASLERRDLAAYRRLMRKTAKRYEAGGTQITLLDPGSGVELFWLGTYHAARQARLAPMQRYQMCLQSHDPKGTLSCADCYSLRNYLLTCPFCGAHKKFSMTCTEEEDRWNCFHCKEAGDSLRLVFMTSGRKYTHWKENMPEPNAAFDKWGMETEKSE